MSLTEFPAAERLSKNWVHFAKGLFQFRVQSSFPQSTEDWMRAENQVDETLSLLLRQILSQSSMRPLSIFLRIFISQNSPF